MSARNLVLVQNNPLMRLALRELARRVAPELGFMEVDSFARAREVLAGGPEISLVLLDTTVPDCGGFVGLYHLRQQWPNIPVIVIAANADADSVSRAVAFGAAGYIERSASCEVIERALSSIVQRKTLSPLQVATKLGQPNPIAALTPAQLRVLLGVKRGLRNKQIAFELGLTERTVKVYLSGIYRKLGVGSRTQALILLQEFSIASELQIREEAEVA